MTVIQTFISFRVFWCFKEALFIEDLFTLGDPYPGFPVSENKRKTHSKKKI